MTAFGLLQPVAAQPFGPDFIGLRGLSLMQASPSYCPFLGKCAGIVLSRLQYGWLPNAAL
jgi:hypothetical protein